MCVVDIMWAISNVQHKSIRGYTNSVLLTKCGLNKVYSTNQSEVTLKVCVVDIMWAKQSVQHKSIRGYTNSVCC